MEKPTTRILQRRPLPQSFIDKNLKSTPSPPRQQKERKRERKKKEQRLERKDLDELNNCVLPLGPKPFPFRDSQKPPWQFRKPVVCHNEVSSNLQYSTDRLVDETYALLSFLKSYPSKPKPCTAVTSIQTTDVDEQHDIDDESTQTITVINLPREDELPETYAAKPWRLFLLEEAIFEQERMKEINHPIIRSNIHHHLSNLSPTNKITNGLCIEGEGAKQQIDTLRRFEIELEHFVQDREKGLEPRRRASTDKYFPGSKLLRDYYEDGSFEELEASHHALGSQAALGGKKFYWNKNETKLNLKQFPEQLLFAKHIVYLNLRNNPLTEIPDGIKKLKKIRYLNVSFCLIPTMGDAVFTLKNLEVLDVSYNFLKRIDPRIKELTKLKELYADGNYIRFFPTSLMALKLQVLNYASNFTHKLFWKESIPHTPQTLFELSATCLAKHPSLYRLDYRIRNFIDGSVSKCDLCSGLQFWNGISVIKPVANLFRLRIIPILFNVCSQLCRKQLLITAHLEVTELMTYKRMGKNWQNRISANHTTGWEQLIPGIISEEDGEFYLTDDSSGNLINGSVDSTGNLIHETVPSTINLAGGV